MSLTRETKVLQHAIRAAVQAHRPQQLRHLLATHQTHQFAQALAGLPSRLMEDALSMLGDQERQAVESTCSVHSLQQPSPTLRFLRFMSEASHCLNRFAPGGLQ